MSVAVERHRNQASLDRRILFDPLFDYPGLLTGSPLGNTCVSFHLRSRGFYCAPCGQSQVIMCWTSTKLVPFRSEERRVGKEC